VHHHDGVVALYHKTGLTIFEIERVRIRQDDCQRIDVAKLVGEAATIQAVKVDRVGLVYVLSSTGEVVVVNPALPNDAQGLVYRFRVPFNSAPLLDFFLVDQDGRETEARPSPAQDKVEEFLLKKKLKPSGQMITVQGGVACLWDFDREYDQKKRSCKMLSQLVLANSSKVVEAQYADGVLLLQHCCRARFSIVQLGLAKEGNATRQFLQLNLVELPEFESKSGLGIHDFTAKRLRDGQLLLSLRHLTERGVARDLMTTAADQRELYGQLVRKGMITPPPLAQQVFSESPACHDAAKALGAVASEAHSLLSRSRAWYAARARKLAGGLHAFNTEAAREEARAGRAVDQPGAGEADPLLELLESFKRRLEEAPGAAVGSPQAQQRSLGGTTRGDPRLLTTADMDSFMRSAFGYRPQQQTERETRQLIGLFNEQDGGEPLNWELELPAPQDREVGRISGTDSPQSERGQGAEARNRLVSEDIFREIDEQIYTEHGQRARAGAVDGGDCESPGGASRAGTPPAEAVGEGGRLDDAKDSPAGGEGSDEGDQREMDVEDSRGLRLAAFSDKHLQKLQRLSDQQLERVRLISQTVEKSTQAFKKLNNKKGFKQQSQQLPTKVQAQLGLSLKTALTESSEKLGKGTVEKAQDYYGETLSQSLAGMRARLQAKVGAQHDEQLHRRKRHVDTVTESTRRCMQGELAPVVCRTLEGCLQGHLQAQYGQLAGEYASRQREAGEQFTAYLDQCEEVLRRGLGLRPVESSNGREGPAAQRGVHERP